MPPPAARLHAAPLLATPLLGPWDRLGIVVAAAVLVVGAGVLALLQRRTRGAAPGERAGATGAVSRRQLLERGVIGVFAAGLVGVATAAIDYVARAADARGRTFTVGTPEAIRHHLETSGPYRDPVGGFYVVPYPAGDLAEAEEHYAGGDLDGMRAGFVALDQACTHLGCRVPWCPSSQWFECPCHGSRYNAVGEQRRGPAPRGLDRYRVRVVDGQVTVDTSVKYLGPPPGTDTTDQQAAGPHCF